jgi:hypothetical protein
MSPRKRCFLYCPSQETTPRSAGRYISILQGFAIQIFFVVLPNFCETWSHYVAQAGSQI